MARAAVVQLLEGERDDEPMLLHRSAQREVDGIVVHAFLADQADQRPVRRLVIVLGHEAYAPALAVLDHVRACQQTVQLVAAPMTEPSEPGGRARRLWREQDDGVVLRRASRGAPDQGGAIG